MKTLKYFVALLSVVALIAGCSTTSSQNSGATAPTYESATGAGSGPNGSIGPNNPLGLSTRE